LRAGEATRAKDLFDKLEPLQKLLTGQLDTYNPSQNRSDFMAWAQRVFDFRDVGQINQEIDRLSAGGLGPAATDPNDAPEQLAADLRAQVALEMIGSQPALEPAEVAKQLKLQVEMTAELLVHAGLCAHDGGETPLAITLLRRAAGHESFQQVANGWRRAA